MNMFALILALAVPGCDSNCIDGVCPDLAHDVQRPGPCESALVADDYSSHCWYRYEQTRLVRIECQWRDSHGPGIDLATWTYDANGELRIDSSITTDVLRDNSSAAWVFDAMQVRHYTADGTGSLLHRATFDRAAFRFLPAPGSEVKDPQAELGLVSENGISYVWTRTGSTLTRTSQYGDVVTFDVDDRDRIVRRSAYGGEAVSTWTFDGDLLVERNQHPSRWPPTIDTYQYDAAGNLAMRHGTWKEFSRDETFAYECWK